MEVYSCENCDRETVRVKGLGLRVTRKRKRESEKRRRRESTWKLTDNGLLGNALSHLLASWVSSLQRIRSCECFVKHLYEDFSQSRFDQQKLVSFLVFTATAEALPCPVGTHNSHLGRGALASCEPCPAGFYCLENTTLPSGACSPGYYCPTNITNGQSGIVIGSYGPRQVPCPAGTFTGNHSSRVEADCAACPEGSFCPPGTSTPTVCPRGYYCPGGVGAGVPCPIGTYGAEMGLPHRENCTSCDPGEDNGFRSYLHRLKRQSCTKCRF